MLIPKIRYGCVRVLLYTKTLQPLFAQQFGVLAAIFYAVNPALCPGAVSFCSLGLGVVLLANYYFCARFGLFYLALLPACSTVDFLVGLGLMR